MAGTEKKDSLKRGELFAGDKRIKSLFCNGSADPPAGDSK